ncbi:MAG: 16S rRNA (cytosine(1402)-N(4))-methyltransferase RsmH [Candidatus Aminicenantes bacterium]|nr:16S rRNA (cytosine(1402)-N(4))-methyltransferase RsmH [Candidatus Aminicenantes bacterium]
MSREVLDIFAGTRKRLFVDCTLGMGGHCRLILFAFSGARVIAIDQDGQSLARARENLREFGRRIRFHQGDFLSLFDDFDCEHPPVSGILVDPGISTAQLKDPRRGFSHSVDGPLDMRKDSGSGPTAAEVLNSLSEDELADLFSRYGEVASSRRLAKAIIEKRLFSPWKSTVQLRRLIEELFGWRPRPGRVHPAAQVFQALRIFVNRELEGLEAWLERLPSSLPSGCRVVFLTYHSLEDRVVKRMFRQLQRQGRAALLPPFPARPRGDEIEENLASRSAKLRALEVA